MVLLWIWGAPRNGEKHGLRWRVHINHEPISQKDLLSICPNKDYTYFFTLSGLQQPEAIYAAISSCTRAPRSQSILKSLKNVSLAVINLFRKNNKQKCFPDESCAFVAQKSASLGSIKTSEVSGYWERRPPPSIRGMIYADILWLLPFEVIISRHIK